MEKDGKLYITTAIDYVNAAPHIGHAYEKIATDVLARYFKQRGTEVFFLTGTDEHGIKIEKTSRDKGVSPQEFCDETAQKFVDCWDLLDVKYDRFIRTTETEHQKVVNHIFKTLMDKGDIYKASYTGLYCAGCEAFLNERDLTEDGFCPQHNAKPQEVKEENYFFKLTAYKDKIIDHIMQNKNFIMPEFKKNELLNQLKDMEDFSVSRSKEAVSWGISVPGDDAQVIYVWIDALSNYLTGIGYLNNTELYEKFWVNNPNKIHIIGKDILKFHAIYWIAILMGMDIPLPDVIFAHGWITVDRTKMSKTLGNVIAPKAVMDAFNLETSDSLRYFLMTTAIFGMDGNYSDEDFKNKVNADLANNLGNLLNRTLSMLVKYFDGEIKPEHITNINDIDGDLARFSVITKNLVNDEAFSSYKISDAAVIMFTLVDAANKYVNDKTPWSLAKEGKMTDCGRVLYNVLETLRFVSVMIYPFTPNIAQNMWEQLAQTGNIEDFKYIQLHWGGIQAGKIASKDSVKPVFLRLDSDIVGEDKKKK